MFETRILIAVGAFVLLSLLITVFATTPVCFLAGPGTDYPHIQDAIQAAKPGCTVVLLAGLYRENLVITKPIRLIPRSHVVFAYFTQGNPGGEPFAIFASPARPVILEAVDPGRPAVEVRAEGVELRGLVIRGGSQGILVAQTRSAWLTGNQISNSVHAGIALVNVSESTVQENEISQSETGILLEGSLHNHLVSNQLQTNTRGLVLRNSRENEVRANRASSNQGEGFLMETSDRNEWVANRGERNSWGLVVLSSSGDVFRENRFDRNTHSLRVWGDAPGHFVHQMDRSNTIDGRVVDYLVNEKNVTIRSQDQPGFVALVNSEGITVEGITLNNAAEGILLVNTQGSTIRNNVLLNTVRGVYVWNSRNIEISGNRIERTEENGITVMGSQGVRLLKNYVSASGGHGVLLSNSQEDELSENQLEGNRESGAHLEASRKIVLEQNQIRGNWVGVFVEQGGAHVIQGNWIRESQFGIFIHESTDNRISGNHLENNHHDTNVSDQPPPPAPKTAPSSPASSGGS